MPRPKPAPRPVIPPDFVNALAGLNALGDGDADDEKEDDDSEVDDDDPDYVPSKELKRQRKLQQWQE